MDYLYALLEALLAALRALWPGVGGAAVAGYLGMSVMGFPGLLIGAAAGALAGTWLADRAGLAPVRRPTGRRGTDLLVVSSGAFLVVAAIYVLMQVAMIIAAVAAVAVLGLLWLSS